ncbi:MAG: ABC transporter permease [Acidimicrobiales bacterium]
MALPLQADGGGDASALGVGSIPGAGNALVAGLPTATRRGRRGLPWFSGGALVVFVLTGLIGPFVSPYGQQEINLADSLKPPIGWGGSFSHPLGTDDLGRDILARLVFGSRVAMLVSLAVVLIAGVIGLSVALLAGYRGGRIDSVLMRTTDAALAFPVLLFAIVWVGVFGASTRNVVIILGLAFWPSYARVLRAEVLRVKTMDFVTMARTMGAGGRWVVWRHVLPNIMPTLLVLVTLQLGLAIVAEGALSFLGLGVPAPAASWGGMLADGRKHLSDGWWMAIMPGLSLSVTVLATNLFGDWLRVNNDPTTKR